MHYPFPNSTHVCDAGTLKFHVIFYRIQSLQFTEVPLKLLLQSCMPPASADKSDCVYETVCGNSNISMCAVGIVRPVNNDLHHLIINLLFYCFVNLLKLHLLKRGCSPLDLLHISTTRFYQNIYGWLPLK